MSPRRAGALAVGCALVVVVVWFVRRQAPRAESVTDATLAVHVTKHDAFGAPSKPLPIRDRGKVRRIMEALAPDTLATMTCPADYATADIGLLLTGRDVYARRNAYVWEMKTASPRVVIVDETGCRGGAVADPARLLTELGL